MSSGFGDYERGDPGVILGGSWENGIKVIESIGNNFVDTAQHTAEVDAIRKASWKLSTERFAGTYKQGWI